jgi:hypothetical protein
MSDVDNLTLISKLPKRVFVDEWEFHLKLVDEGAPELFAKGDENDSDPGEDAEADGLTDLAKKRIYLCKTLTLHRFVEVVIHELTHTINWSRDVDDGSTEEIFTTKFSAGFLRFLLDNPRVHQWLNRAIRAIREQQKNVGNISD